MKRRRAFPMAGLAAALGLLAAGAAPAQETAQDQAQIVYSDGHADTVAVENYEGAEHIAVRDLEKALHTVDAGATMENQYDSKSLQLV
ncbi:MAG: hypothetical protein NTW86_19835, partial [Candidatus Sumerlaeota bacterium]|nr:hypothetical protein [Candidatus Sumerlaeota bacterium]